MADDRSDLRRALSEIAEGFGHGESPPASHAPCVIEYSVGDMRYRYEAPTSRELARVVAVDDNRR